MEPNEEAISQAIEVLNRIHEKDPTVLPKLIDFRVPCTEILANDPTVQVGVNKDTYGPEVGFLGIINGLFGVDQRSVGYIVALYEKGKGLVGFRRMTPTDFGGTTSKNRGG